MHRLFAIPLALVAFSAFAAEQKVIEITGANFRPMPIAIAIPWAYDASAAEFLPEFDAALTYDFAACGIFQTVDRKAFLAKPDNEFKASSFDFRPWRDTGAEALIKVRLSLSGDTLIGELKYYDVASGTEQFRAEAKVPKNIPRRLAHLLADVIYRSLVKEESPFLSRITFTGKSGRRDRDVWVTDWDGSNGVKITRSGLNVLPAFRQNVGVAYTAYGPDGADLVYRSFDGKTVSTLLKVGSLVVGVAYSPDGNRLAASVVKSGSTEIWVADANGANATAVTNTPGFLNTSPTWSPDGKSIAFVSNRAGNPQIYLMNPDGSGVRRLTFQGNYNTTPAFSPRGDVIAFTGRDERNAFDIFTVSVSTGKIVRLTQGLGNSEEPTYSPSGRLIIYIGTRGGTARLFVMTADGNNSMSLPVRAAQGEATPDWSR